MSKPHSTHWAELGELGFFSGMRLLFWAYRYLGSWAFEIVIQPVVLYYFCCNRLARCSSRDYLHRAAQAGAEGLSANPSWVDVYRHLYSFARSSVDKLGVWANADMLEDVEFPQHPILLEQQASGKGAVLLGAHLGNIEVCRSLSRRNKTLKLNILVHTRHADKFNRLLGELEAERRLELIEVTEVSPATVIRLTDCIARGEFVAILSDRIPVASRGRATDAQFLGATAQFPEGPFILAALLRCPVYTLFCVRTDSGYLISSEKFADQVVLPRDQRKLALQSYVQQFASVLEQHVLKVPFQWFNFYPFWSQRL